MQKEEDFSFCMMTSNSHNAHIVYLKLQELDLETYHATLAAATYTGY